MKINNKAHITMSDEDVKDAIIKYLYQNQGVSGIFNIEFKFRYVTNGLGTDCCFDGVEITVDLNEKIMVDLDEK